MPLERVWWLHNIAQPKYATYARSDSSFTLYNAATREVVNRGISL